MPVRQLPAHPNLAHLRQQTKDLIKAHAACTLAAAQLLREFHPRFAGLSDDAVFNSKIKLSDAQLTIAREHGFASWPRLKARIEKPKPAHNLALPHHERIEDPELRQAVSLLDAGNVEGLRTHLRAHSGLTKRRAEFEGVNYFRNPTLLQFIAENPIRHNKMPANICAIAEVILEAGCERSELDETLRLVASGSVAQACGQQIPLIDLLCDHGADRASAIRTALLHGCVDAVQALIRRGAPVDLPVAVLGPEDEFRRLLPSASPADRHLALAVATQYGRIEIVRILLDAGEDPSRFNPIGGHSHSTPLHQAAGYGPLELVKLLVERGARVDTRDVLWHGTPADWAHHERRTEIEAWLWEEEMRQKAKK